MTQYASASAKIYPPIGYVSAHAPLLSRLHERLSEYEDAVAHAYNLHEKYGTAAAAQIEPPSGEMLARLKRTSMAFDAIVSHVDAVDAHLDNDYVLLHRDACKPSNGLFHSPPCEEKDEDDDRTIRTTSPILANSAELDLSFRPYPSSEVLIRSPILANSYELRLLASPIGWPA